MSEDDENSKKSAPKPENYGKERVRELQGPIQTESDKTQQTKSEQETPASNSANEEEKSSAFKNLLLGEIDENRTYRIPDEIAKELIVLEKIVTSKDDLGYKAYAICGPLKLNFIISVKELIQDESTFKVAYLKLVESYKKQQEGEKSYIVTTLAKFQDIFSDDYLFKVKKAFHLHSKEESEGKVFEENEILAPLTLSLFNRFTMLETNKIKVNLELKHLQDLLKILNATPKGKVIAEKFIKQTNFRTEGVKGKEYSYSKLKEILYQMIDSAIQQKKLEAPVITKISEAKAKHIAEIKKETGKESMPFKEKPAGKSASKSSGSESKSKGKGGGDKKKDKGEDKKKDKGKDKGKDKKDKQMIDVLDLLIERSKNSGNQAKSGGTASKSNTQSDTTQTYAAYRGFVSKEVSINPTLVYSNISPGKYHKTQNSEKQQEQELGR